MTTRRCNHKVDTAGATCGIFYDVHKPACPDGHPRNGHNKFLRTAQLNNHLFGMAERAEKEKRFATRSGA